MTRSGGCHCGAVKYEAKGDTIAHALCHCEDCRRHSGAPMVGWALFPEAQVSVTKGELKIYQSSENGRRHFCADCGTGLFYTNSEMLAGIIDIKSATLDDPDALPAQCHIQTSKRIGWMKDAHALPEYEGFPPSE